MRTNRRHLNQAVSDADAFGSLDLVPTQRWIAFVAVGTGSVSVTAGAALGGTNGGPGNIIREDLSDVYRLLAVTETPFMSRSGDKNVNAVFSEWTEDTLGAPADGVERIEGDAKSGLAVAVPLRLKNVCQINDETPSVTGTGQAVDSAGIDDPMAWAVAKRTKELKRTMERRAVLPCYAAPANTPAYASGHLVHRTSSVAGKTRSLAHFLAFDAPADRGDGLGTAPCMLNLGGGTLPISEVAAGTAPTDANLILLTLAHINTAKQKNYVAGGSATLLIVSPNQKANISGMFGKGTTTAYYQNSAVDKNELSTNVTMIETPFGDLKVVPNLFISDLHVLGIDPSLSSIGWLRKVGSTQLAKIGDGDSKLVNGEWCVRPDAIRAHFGITGIKAA
jgi:hypothetical protein